ncbi:DUF2291 family protein [Candidatus Pantoea multigeneris]|uniref:DUF2291 domain-containing protein n=1 Tax=Candidatus Pantoea multigeneris TaxID=2608357 RepID=A0ABX0RFJ0_9GAMM|nr:DUF2291 domain-containing protein [Pantoea multigeneris]NIF22434.1 DUF2291 domain-containing protein [Pantoea multigeneris]
MLTRIGLTLIIIMLSGCRIVSQKELADLKNPPNPKMANISQTWQSQIVPQIGHDAKPAAELLKAVQSAKDFDEACKTYGYRSQDENPCAFSVQVSGTITKVDTTSRSGKIIIKDASGQDITVQMGPIIRGTLLRDAYKGASYNDFNDQVMYGDYGKAINQFASTMMQDFKPKEGDNVTITGVFSSWDIPQSIPDVTPASIKRQ